MAARLGLLVIVATGVIVMATAVARLDQSPGHDGALAVNTCDLPCYRGMTPGTTHRDEAVGIVDRLTSGAWSELNDDIFFSIPDSLGRRLLVTLDFTPAPLNTLRAIRFSPRDAGARLLRLGDILRTRGAAISMRACESTITRVSLSFSSGIEMTGALMARTRLAPGDALIMFDISSVRRPRAPYDANPFGCTQMDGWHGFAPFFTLARYAP